MFAWAVPISIGAMTVFDWLARVYRRYDIDIMEGDLLPSRGAAWGAVRCWNPNYSKHDFRYFVVRLPSLDWQPHPERLDGRCRWVQRALLWFEPSGWRLIYLEPLHGQ